MKSILSKFVLLLGLLACSCSDTPVALRSDVPLTRTVAMTKMTIPLPASAHDIYYADYCDGGWQSLNRYIRFDMKREELPAAVDALIANNNKIMKESLPYPRSALNVIKLPVPRKEILPMPWWDPQTIKSGYYRGEDGGFTLHILVDEKRSRIYIYQFD